MNYPAVLKGLLASAVLLVSTTASAIEFRFDNLPGLSSFTQDGVTVGVSCFANEGGCSITKNNEGLGVDSGFLDNNDVDGNGTAGDEVEALIFSFGAVYELVGIRFENVDSNDSASLFVDSLLSASGDIDAALGLASGSANCGGDQCIVSFDPGFFGSTFAIGAFGKLDNFRIEGITVAAVPEPATVFLMGLGLLGIAMRRRYHAQH